MGAVPQNILQWLHSALTAEYLNANRAYSDVAQTLSYHPNFALRTDVYIYENGASALLLNLKGILPVKFRGTTYGFPISIWIPQDYPKTGPIGFVTPTKDMAVRPGQHVSGEGRVYHPYLTSWTADRSNLYEFFLILQDTFQREPPVVARQVDIPRHSRSEQQNGNPPPVPPLPPELGNLKQGVQLPRRRSDQQAPPPPPKPFGVQGLSNLQSDIPQSPIPHYARHSNTYDPSRSAHEGGYARESQPLPLYAPQRAGSLQLGSDTGDASRQNHSGLYQQARQEPFAPINAGTNLYAQDIHRSRKIDMSPLQNGQQGPPTHNYGHLEHVSASLPQDNGPRSHFHNAQQYMFPQQYQQQPYRPQHDSNPPKPKPPEDLLTSPFENPLTSQPANVAPPPIPPNPQKDALLSALSQTLTDQVHNTHESNLAALPPLRAQQAALTSTLNAINAEMSRLNDLENLLCSNENILHKAMQDADKVLEDAKRRNVPNVDEVLVAPTVVAGQLYQLVAEQRAIEESRGVLGKALDKGRIGGVVWARVMIHQQDRYDAFKLIRMLQQTRSLAREEFLKKAMVKKISIGMGLVADDRY